MTNALARVYLFVANYNAPRRIQSMQSGFGQVASIASRLKGIMVLLSAVMWLCRYDRDWSFLVPFCPIIRTYLWYVRVQYRCICYTSHDSNRPLAG